MWVFLCLSGLVPHAHRVLGGPLLALSASVHSHGRDQVLGAYASSFVTDDAPPETRSGPCIGLELGLMQCSLIVFFLDFMICGEKVA